MQRIKQSLLDLWRGKTCKSPHFYYCYYFPSTTLQLRNVLFIKRFYMLEKLRKCYGTENQSFFPFGVMNRYFTERCGLMPLYKYGLS